MSSEAIDLRKSDDVQNAEHGEVNCENAELDVKNVTVFAEPLQIFVLTAGE